MRILVATTGSDGDIRPFLALSLELKSRNHKVFFAAPDRYAQEVTRCDLSFIKIGSPWNAQDAEASLARILKTKGLQQLVVIMELLTEHQLPMVADLLTCIPEVDVIVHPSILVAAAAVARVKKIPHVSVQLAPLTPSCSYSPQYTDLGSLLNRLMWSIATKVIARTTDKHLNKVIQAAGLKPWRNVLLSSLSSALDLIAVSSQVFSPDPKWSSHHLTGYWYLDDASQSINQELVDFLKDDAPIVIGFGSMTGFEVEKVTRQIFSTVQNLKDKVVILSGWSGLGKTTNIPKNVYITPFVSHHWLFKRAACVIHHGGAGTTAAALRAGIPQAIVWHLGDQLLWGKKTKALGVSPGFISHQKLTTAWLSSSIQEMKHNKNIKDKAQKLGTSIRTEKGVEKAAALIEKYFDKTGGNNESDSLSKLQTSFKNNRHTQAIAQRK